uniref:phosphatidate phosphatase n=1 Tax=Lepisosteus oculatus TaxID=7918 RepID=W5NIZ1_LEPOC
NIHTQTMNYVGQLAGQMFVQVKELYRGLNPATLSGCIDVIVVRQPDGSLQCSPFHVRFGKMGVLRSREKLVDIEINGEPVSLHMKLGENGEAFFVKETENDKEVVPSYLATSPILSDGAALMEAQLGSVSARGSELGCPGQTGTSSTAAQSGAENPNCSVKKRRKRRRKSRVDSVKREDSGDYSEDEDMFPIDMSSDDETELADSTRMASREIYSDEVPMGKPIGNNLKQSIMYACSDGEWSPVQSPTIGHKGLFYTLPIPASSGLSVSCPQQSSLFQPSDSSSPGGSRPSTPKSDSELVTKVSDKAKQDNPQMLWAWGELPQAAKCSPSFLSQSEQSVLVNIPVSESTHFRVISGDSPTEAHEDCPPSPLPLEAAASESEAAAEAEMEAGVRPAGETPRPLAESEEPYPPAGQPRPASKTDSPSKRKDKRSRHLGADGVYLDDITELEPEVAALYFPKSSDASGPGRSSSENGARSANQSPQSVGSSGMDSGVDSFSDQIGDLPSIAISLCGGLTDNKEITKEQFQEKEVSYQQFADNPAIIDDPHLVVKIGNKYYNWTTAAPIMLAMQAFQKPLPKTAVENIMKEKMPKKGGRWWFSWRGRNSSVKVESNSEQGANLKGEEAGKMASVSRLKDESSSSDEDHRTAEQSSAATQQDSVSLSSTGVSYKKTLRLTSEQLVSLQLKDGPNDVVFSVTTQYQGTCRCEGTIYLWSWNDKIVISDIDGTITRSDTLGHILPTLGKDWTHQGIARLYHKVSQNGYKFLYCSARAIGMAGMTRGYLHWVNERGTMLPQGPVLLSPSSLFSALHREVIEKKPEKFKIECLTDIKNLFYPNTQPFYAAFGNRATDVYSYKEVGVPLNRIFTVNPKGELIQEHAKTNISSYVRLCEVVDHVFPLMTRKDSSDFPCSDTFSHFNYWREQLPTVENQDIQLESS